MKYKNKNSNFQAPSQKKMDALLLAFSQKAWSDTEHLALQITKDFPNHPLGWKALAAVYKQTGQLEKSLVPAQRSVELAPDDAQAHNNLGLIFFDLNRMPEAETSLLAAIAARHEYAEAYYNLGNIRIYQGRLHEAETFYRQALIYDPEYPAAYNNLGNILIEQGRIKEAIACLQENLKINPYVADAHNNLGNALKELGQLNEAIASYRQALKINPNFSVAHSNLIFSQNYIDNLSPEIRLQEALRFGTLASQRVQHPFTSWNIKPENNKIKIGFVSGDLRNHPVGYFLEGLLKHLDKDRFELSAYSTTPFEDDLTQRIKSHFTSWLTINSISDESAAQAIHHDGIQILIDLAGHTAKNRLSIFSHKPAPVQVSWLGYFATTGLKQIDYILGDPYVTPETESHHFCERIWRLAETYLCFTPPDFDIPVGELPASKNGYITFGCFNHLSKINTRTIDLWSDILRALPGSKLFLKTKQLNDLHVIDKIRNQFTESGVLSECLIFEGSSSREDYLKAYHRVDIALDPFPYPGGTTSVEGLWMGVPVITLQGDCFLSHNGETLAHNSKQSHWIAQNEQDYVQKAKFYASDLVLLAKTRSDLRDQILASPLFNAPRFARNFEAAMMGLWEAAEYVKQSAP